VPPNQRQPVIIHLDEAPDLLRLPLDLADALAQARGYRIGFTLAAQFRSQYPPALRDAIDANTLSKICFRQPATDAKAMQTITGGQIEAEDFMTLNQYQIYATLAVNGHPGDWFSAKTLPPPAAISNPARIRQQSRQRYGQPPQQAVAETRPANDNSSGSSENLGRKKRAS
jgi:hypothetical protein